MIYGSTYNSTTYKHLVFKYNILRESLLNERWQSNKQKEDIKRKMKELHNMITVVEKKEKPGTEVFNHFLMEYDHDYNAARIAYHGWKYAQSTSCTDV